MEYKIQVQKNDRWQALAMAEVAKIVCFGSRKGFLAAFYLKEHVRKKKDGKTTKKKTSRPVGLSA